MTLAVTGGTGFVGQAVLDAAESQGILVRALTRRAQEPRASLEWVSGDLQNGAALSELVNGAAAVLHVAGVVNAPDPNGFHVGNVLGTEALVDAARAANVERFILVSSLAAREPGLSAYGTSKRHSEEVVQTSGLDWTIVRPPAIYGPRDREIFELFRAARWGVVPMPPEGRASIIHADDLARLLLALVPSVPSVSQRILEPDDGQGGGWSHRDLAREIGLAIGRRVWAPALPAGMLRGAARLDGLLRGKRAKLTADRVGYMVHSDWVSHPARAVPAGIWRPRLPTPEGLRKTAQWYRDQGWL